jgi:hypothetical protein
MTVTARTNFRALTIGAAFVVSAASCVEPLGPTDIAGTYVATRIAGAPLPSQQPLWDAVRFVIADTLQVEPNGTGTWVEVSEITGGSGPPFRFARLLWFRTERQGTQLQIRAGGICQMECDPAQVFLLTPVGSSLYLSVNDQVRQYERVDAAP